jgi:glycosyltransferase involved in cell wall biosynthesis
VSTQIHHYLRKAEAHVRKGQAVLRALMHLRDQGFKPDLICVHAGWGEGLFIKDAFPSVPVLAYFEFFYHGRGVDLGFDPEIAQASLDDECRVRIWNATHLLTLTSCEWGQTATQWQKQIFPELFHDNIHVVHEGIPTDIAEPDLNASIVLPGGLRITREIPVVTYVSRNLEPTRGFHIFMRTLPAILAANPHAVVLILGGDEVSYGRSLPNGQTYREKYLAESEIDISRVFFLGRIPYHHYLKVLQISSVHVYLTYPFVLSWSMLVASDTPPVREVITDGDNGLLVDFFDTQALTDRVTDVLSHRDQMDLMRENARKTIVDRYDLKTICLPQQERLIHELVI